MTYKDFLTGAVFTAADADLLMRQGIMVVSNAAARDAIDAPTEGMRVYRLDTHRIEAHNGTTWTTGTWTAIPRAAGIGGTVEYCILDGSSVEIRGAVTGSFIVGDTNVCAVGGIPLAVRPTQFTPGSCYIDGGYVGVALAVQDGRIVVSQQSGATRPSAYFRIKYALES